MGKVVSTTVTKRFTLEVAHYLPDYKGKCVRLHGHSIILHISITGNIDSKSGMVIDYSEIKRIVQPIIDKFDHSCLNDWFTIPTSENVGKYIFEYLEKEFLKEGHWLANIRLYETEDSWCDISSTDVNDG